MKTIYHYCTSETFKTILENKTLKFSDIVKSNDYKEIIYLWDKYYEYIDKIAKNRVSVSELKYEIRNQLDKELFHKHISCEISTFRQRGLHTTVR